MTVSNGGFCGPGQTKPFVPNCGIAHVDILSDWRTRTKHYCNSCYPASKAIYMYEHSPDLNSKLCSNTDPDRTVFKGQNSIFMAANNKEIAMQTMNKKLWPGHYIFSGFLLPETAGLLYTPNTENFFSIHFNDEDLSFKSESNCYNLLESSPDYYEFNDEPLFSFDFNFNNTCKNALNKMSYHFFSYEIGSDFGMDKIDNFTLEYHGAQKNQRYDYNNPVLSEGINFDEISLQRKSCYCPDDLWIENYSFYNAKIQANETIRLGFNVENVTQNGNVTISGDKNVFSAGKSVTLENGTITTPGSKYTIKIQPCSFKTGNMSASMSTAAAKNATKPFNDYWHINSSNATDYYFELFNRWGDKVKTYYGQFDDNGKALIFPPYDRDDQSFVGQLRVFNCDGTEKFIKVDMLYMFKNTSNLFENTISLYPNPAKDELNIIFSKVQNSNNYVIEIIDIIGKRITENNINFDNKSDFVQTKLNLESFSNGIYFVNIYNGKTKLYTNKFVIDK